MAWLGIPLLINVYTGSNTKRICFPIIIIIIIIIAIIIFIIVDYLVLRFCTCHKIYERG